MVTTNELLRVLLLPLLVSAVVAGVGRWRRLPWCAPLAAGVGFLAGYAAVGVPKLPPADGTDWLFWLAVPLTLLGGVIARFGGRAGWLLGLAAGAVSYGVARPIVPGAVSPHAALLLAGFFAAAGVAVSAATRVAASRAGAWAVGVGWAVVVGGAAVLVMSSNLRVVGVYGIAAAAAVGPAGVLGAPRLRGFGPVAAGLLAGLLTGGRLYPDPGVAWTPLVIFALAPLLLAFAALLPTRRRWVRGVVGVVLVAVAVAAVVVPAAVAAKHAAEDDPYAGQY